MLNCFFPKKKKFCRKIGDKSSRRNSMIITKGLKEGPDIRSVYGLGRTSWILENVEFCHRDRLGFRERPSESPTGTDPHMRPSPGASFLSVWNIFFLYLYSFPRLDMTEAVISWECEALTRVYAASITLTHRNPPKQKYAFSRVFMLNSLEISFTISVQE